MGSGRGATAIALVLVLVSLLTVGGVAGVAALRPPLRGADRAWAQEVVGEVAMVNDLIALAVGPLPAVGSGLVAVANPFDDVDAISLARACALAGPRAKPIQVLGRRTPSRFSKAYGPLADLAFKLQLMADACALLPTDGLQRTRIANALYDAARHQHEITRALGRHADVGCPKRLRATVRRCGT